MLSGTVPVYGGNGISGYHSNFNFSSERLIIGRVGEHCGNVFITEPVSWVTDNALIVSFTTKEHPLLFWQYLLNGLRLRTHAYSSAQPVITAGTLNRILVKYPPPNQQQKIALILLTLDTQITKTQALIDKYTAIKQGMMTDLFSRGIDITTGQLRPSFEEAPELYKETELGWVPKEWEVYLLKEKIKNCGFVQTGPFGSQLHSYEYVETSVPVAMPQDLLEGYISLDKIAKITEEKANALSRHLVKDNDVIFSRRGDLTRSAYISEDRGNVGFFCGTGCLLLRVPANVIYGGWFSLLYGTPIIQNQVDGLAVGSTMPNLNSSILGKLLIPCPSATEQREIFNRVNHTGLYIAMLENEQHKRKLQKKGLMQNLLSGRKSVKIEEQHND